MKRPSLIALAGILVAIAAYCGFYYAGTADTRKLVASPEPELAWLKSEFHLSDAEFARISQMHEQYLAGCAERCRQIDEKNAELKRLLASTNAVTPQIQAVLADAARLRAECQRQMLEHFYAVSRTMPPEQGQRYLAWVQDRTILADAHRGMHPGEETGMEGHHH
jgi:Spy/CpxP family protein refolding chaperone